MTQELVIITANDIVAVAVARSLVNAVNDAVAVAPPEALGDMNHFRHITHAVAELLVQALRSADGHDELARLREATFLLMEVRAMAWRRHTDGVISAPMFDEIIVVAARCDRELGALERATRARLRRGVDAA